ncbi:MAG: DUF4925 domain-containing protein [Muribaculaceae bacterium]|nr:DUF4925 domain-containing protein [Muribaculaceae bacterium]
MRHYLLYSSIAIALLVTGCDKDEASLPQLKSTTYSAGTLTVNYCGDEMPSKQIVFTPSAVASDGEQTATLEMSGILDLSSLGIKDIPMLPAPGVLPGDKTTTLSIALVPDKKEGVYTFAGNDKTQYVTFSYTGELSDSHLTINIEDVKLLDSSLAGKVFNPVPVEASLEDLKKPENIKTPFYIRWEIGNLPGLELNPGIIINALTLAPIIPVYNNTAYSSPAQVFDQCVQTMALLPNGNIPVRYYSNHEGATQLLTTNPNMLQYVVTGQNTLQVYINPLSAVGLWLVAQSKPTWLPSFFDTAYAETIKQQIADSNPANTSEADEAIKNALIQSLLLAIKPAMSDGLPLEFTPTDDGINLYLTTETCTDFIGILLGEMVKQPAIAQRLAQYLTQAGLTQEDVAELIQNIPAILQATTKLNIGLSLQNYTLQQ